MEFPDYNFKRKDKGLHIPFTSYDIENEKESTIQMILEDCGFENIVVDYVQTDSADKNGYIKSFTVGTSNSFTVDECYPENVPIKIIAYKLSED